MTERETAGRKERFEILYETLERYNERYVKASVSVSVALLVVIGWLLTSETRQNFFANSDIATVSCIILTVSLILIYWNSILRVYRVNHDMFRKLRELNYVEVDYYRHHLLPLRYMYFGIGLNVATYLVIGVLVANAYWNFL